MHIMLTGMKSSDKDDVVQYLKQAYNFHAVSVQDGQFAIAREIFGVDKPNEFLLGEINHALKNIDRDVWIKYTISQAKNYDRAVIADATDAMYDKCVLKDLTPIRVMHQSDGDLDRPIPTSINKDDVGKNKYIDIVVNDKKHHITMQIDWIMERLGITKVGE